MARAFLPGMIERDSGVFLCVSSVGDKFMGAYESVKAAQIHLARTLDAELEGTNVIIFTIGPGLILTETAQRQIARLAPLYGQTVEEFYEMGKDHILSVEAAGAGFAAAVAFAPQFRGMEIDSRAALIAAGIDFETSSPTKTLTNEERAQAGEPLFWDDPHISSQMLAAHLSPNTDAASRRPETIDRSVAWLIATLNLKPGNAVLDLGCGPGLYASRLAQAGMRVTGVDYSRRSIAYATTFAQENGLDIVYRYENYLELEDEKLYDVALLIYGDFCPLNPEQRATLLKNVYRALKPGGQFVLDVTTRAHRKRSGNQNHWYASSSGFWKPGPHLVLEEGFDYPEQSIWLDQYVVIEPDGAVTVYRNWFQDYTPETVTAELMQGGFSVHSLWDDLTGQVYRTNSKWIGLVTKK